MVELSVYTIPPRGGMISGQGRAVMLTYRVIVGKSGRAFLIPDPEVPNMAGHIYVTDSEDWNKKGDGFGGATLEMPLHDQEDYFFLKGGWHTNAEFLFEETEVDLRDHHLNFVVISRGADYNQQVQEEGRIFTTTVMRDIVYSDPEGGLEGRYHRGLHIAVALAQKHNEAYFLHSAGVDGGSSFQRVHPETPVRDPEDMW